MTYSDLVKRIQAEMNSLGSNLKVDGDPGPKTQAELSKYDILAVDFALKSNVIPLVKVTSSSKAMPPWIEFGLKRLGWTEFDHDEELSKFWPMVGLPQFKTVIGTTHAWCGKEAAEWLYSCGLTFPKGAAGAANWEGYGESCDYICGAVLPIRHAGGGRHVTFFLYWIDRENKIAACLGGNQSNGVRISVINISGNKNKHDEVMTGPRWPKGYPRTEFIYIPSPNDPKPKAASSTR